MLPSAGVSLGPFTDYKSRFFSGSAAELFEFANSDSEVSKRYESALQVALKYGVRITYVGSIDDQLVSLEVCLWPASIICACLLNSIVCRFLSYLSSIHLSCCIRGWQNPCP